MFYNTLSKGRRIVGLLATLGLLFIFNANLRAQDNTPVWCIVADGVKAVPIDNVRFLAAADNDSTFAIVLDDGSAIQGVRCVTTRWVDNSCGAPRPRPSLSPLSQRAYTSYPLVALISKYQSYEEHQSDFSWTIHSWHMIRRFASIFCLNLHHFKQII